MSISKIEWTKVTWNPTTGCSKVSQGCKNCYAEIMHRRLQAMGQAKYQQPFLNNVVCHPSELERPATWKNPTMCFVNSMSDLFHEAVPTDFIKQVFRVMNDTPRHTYQVLTKRPERMAELSYQLDWTPNIWAGTSVEDEKAMDRIAHLHHCNAKVKFLSCEPLIGPLTGIKTHCIDWVIVGGESGPKSRPIKTEWVDEIYMACALGNSSFFFKQWGGRNKKAAGRLYRGRTWDEMPRAYQFA